MFFVMFFALTHIVSWHVVFLVQLISLFKAHILHGLPSAVLLFSVK